MNVFYAYTNEYTLFVFYACLLLLGYESELL